MGSRMKSVTTCRWKTGSGSGQHQVDEVNESCEDELTGVHQCYLQGAHALCVCVCVVCVSVCIVIWGELDLLGEVAAKSSYSKVLVGEWSGRLP